MSVSILDRIVMVSLKAMETSRGVVWEAVLALDGVAKWRVSDDASGGAVRYDPVTFSRNWNDLLDVAERAATEATGQNYEAFGLLCACMLPGDTASAAVARAREALT